MFTNEIYLTIRDAIEDTADERGRSFEEGHEPHYMARAVVLALAAAGYTIMKREKVRA